MVQGAPQTSGATTRRSVIQGAAARGVLGGLLRDRPDEDATNAASRSSASAPLPIVFAEHVAAQGHWGETLREYMRDYVHWATFGALCEFLPRPENRVTLADESGPARPARRQLQLLDVRQRPSAREGGDGR